MNIECIIVTFDSADSIEACIASIVAYLPEARITIVDNDSKDSTLHIVRSLGLTCVKVIQTGSNLGYAGALNAAVLESSADVLIVLNPDLRFTSDAYRLVEALNDEILVAGPRLFDRNGVQFACARRLPSPVRLFVDSLKLPKCLLKILRGQDTYMSEWDHESDRVVPALSGAAFCLTRDTWNRLGGMSTDGFMYYEDIDFFRRVARAGGQCLYISSVSAFHVGAGSSGTVSREDREGLQLGALLLYGLTNGGGGRRWRFALAVGQILRALYSTCLGRLGRARVYAARTIWLTRASLDELKEAQALQRTV